MLAQQKTKIILQFSERGTTDNDITYLRKPVFRHVNATLSCDSAVFYPERNVFEAYRNVHIVQGDTINIYSDYLTYDGNTKNAHLTDNVRMVDKESVLTTNILDYRLDTKIGTYTNGGKIVNKDVTLTSTNGYYFSNTRDAYFKYNVVVVTPEVRITSDTLRYNTATNWAYFYGPTNIKGKGDNLYTENGAYNTKTEYAYFGKRNLYTNAAKSLKGDSLYYDGIKGYGKAVRNIVFQDTSDKTVLYGQLGYYYKADERAVVTRNAYVGMGTKDSIALNKKMVPDTIWLGADTLETQKVRQGTLKLLSFPVLKKDNELGEAGSDEERETPPKRKAPASPKSKPLPQVQKPKALPKSNSRAARRQAAKNKDKVPLAVPDSVTRDSLAKDSVLKITKLRDSVAADSLLKLRGPDSLKKDSLTKDSVTAKGGALKVGALKLPKDSVVNPADTILTRTIKAYSNVRVYKSNMQAVADSLFYASADSTLRWFGKPILWSQGSQQAGDTLYLRLKNNKLNTLQVLENAFLVNVNADSAKHNQIKGKLITAFFNDGELRNMFVDGNAESVYYSRNKDSVYTDMSQTVSARIKILFKNKEIQDLLTIKDAEGLSMPVKEMKEDIFLTGFIWKPELRPLSKQEVIRGKSKTAAKPAAKKAAPPKPKPGGENAPSEKAAPAKPPLKKQ
ncbi:OstA-like protein [Pedobacter deserti]|uniref:OstA-like protein n=1 Tax=Pedobacter deserti TaxID=2817382 RepID=UPI00210B26B7|nr:OstA-like protein [Pedobacter sp. SYSU D00382]